MPDVQIEVLAAEPKEFAAVPQLGFKLGLSEPASDAGPTSFHSIALQCQIRIEPMRRSYGPAEKSALFDLFGHPQQWSQSLRSMLWTHTQTVVGAFSGSTTAELPVPCSFDFNLAATRYFSALEADDVPLCLLFSGTMFYVGEGGALQVSQISWEKEASFRLPVSVWQKMMDHYYPNSVWLRVPRDVFDRLQQYKSRQGLPTWDAALERLLPDQRPAEQPQAVP